MEEVSGAIVNIGVFLELEGGAERMTELIEYAAYHWTFGGDQNLPGLNHDGTIDAEFFDRYPINASYGISLNNLPSSKMIQYSATKILCCYAPAE